MKPLHVFYDECIRTKIRQCDLRASRITCRSRCAKRRAEISRAQAAFFEDNMDELIQKMLANGVGRNLAKINASLIKAFIETFPNDVFHVGIGSEMHYPRLLHSGHE